MIGYWISFGLIIPLVVIGMANLKVMLKKVSKIEVTPEMEKAANERMVIYILFYWLCDLFYMACFINNIVCKYIFGGLIMLIIFMNLAKGITFPKNRSGFERWGMLHDFIVGIGLTIYLIYIIPNDDIKETAIPIIAAVYGGIITLIGVLLTIKKSDRDRLEERRNQIRPFFYYTPYYNGPNYLENKKASIHDKTFSNGKEHADVKMLGRFVNSDKIEFLLKSIIINSVEFKCSFDPAVGKGELFEIDLYAETKLEKFEEYILVLEDVDKNILDVKISLDTSVSEYVVTNIEFLN